jgi:hypothetical protein
MNELSFFAMQNSSNFAILNLDPQIPAQIIATLFIDRKMAPRNVRRAPMVGKFNVTNWIESFNDHVHRLDEVQAKDLNKHSGNIQKKTCIKQVSCLWYHINF